MAFQQGEFQNTKKHFLEIVHVKNCLKKVEGGEGGGRVGVLYFFLRFFNRVFGRLSARGAQKRHLNLKISKNLKNI
jgi:hypothetical protein